MKTTTAVAISGGVDSLMAAYLLKKQGQRIVGLHFLTGFEKQDVDVGAIGDQLGCDIHRVDLHSAFYEEVVAYFVRTYRAGKTPNPCLVCNAAIKFGHLLDAARKLGAARLATGHYARLRRGADGSVHLLRGVDPVKDQSYFLAFLEQRQLALAQFPLGHYRKIDIKAMAASEGFRPTTRSESQDACFIAEDSYRDFVERHVAQLPESGDIVDMQGRVVGRHHGLHRYTVGQRRGLNCPATEPYYVVQLDTHNNRLVVGFKKDTLSRQCRVEQVNWIQPPRQLPLRVSARLRYRHQGAASTLDRSPGGGWIVRFEEPQSAVTPGQGAVLYRKDEVIGGGFIQ